MARTVLSLGRLPAGGVLSEADAAGKALAGMLVPAAGRVICFAGKKSLSSSSGAAAWRFLGREYCPESGVTPTGHHASALRPLGASTSEEYTPPSRSMARRFSAS